MSLRIFSVLSQNLLSQKKKYSKRNERICYKVEVVWRGKAEKKRTKCIVYQMLNLQ